MEPLDGPAGCILEYLVLESGELVLELAAPIFYLLGALTGKQPPEGLVGDRKRGLGSILGILEPSLSPDLSPVLSETQQQLLAKALETTVLSKQLELVRGHGLGECLGALGTSRLAGPASLRFQLQAASITSYPPLLVGEAHLEKEHPMAGAVFCVPDLPGPWGLLGSVG